METLETIINPIDAAVIVLLLLSAVLAAWRGFTHDILSLVSWGAAVAATLYFFFDAQALARQYISQTLIADLVAGAGIFIVTIVVLSLVSGYIGKKVLDSRIGALDRSLGFLYGLIRGAILVSLAYLAMVWLVPEDEVPPMVGDARATPIAAEGARLIVVVANDLLPEDTRITPPPSLFERLERDVRRAYEGQRALDRVRDAVTAPIPPIPSAPPADATEQPGYDDEQRDALDDLIQQQESQP